MIDRDHSTARRYEEEKREIDSRFPLGQFVAIENGQVVADAKSHRELVAKLGAQGKSPNNMLVMQAGVEYPDSAVIFVVAPVQQTHV